MIREGSDITLVGWGAQLSIMEQACVEADKVGGPDDQCITWFICLALRDLNNSFEPTSPWKLS